MGFRILFLSILLTIIELQLSHAQQQNPHLRFDAFTELSLELESDLASTVNNAFMLRYLNAGNIDPALKNENLNRLQTSANLFGNALHGELQFRRLPQSFLGSDKLGFSFAMAYHNTTAIQFTKDVYILYLFGNKQFAGSQADLSQLQFYSFAYQQIKAGLFWQNRDKHHEFGVQLAFNLGSRFQNIQTQQASFLVDSLGSSLQLLAELSYEQCEKTSSLSNYIKGYGSGLDFFYQHTLAQHHKFRFDLKNLGFVRWSKNSLYQEDENLTFTGIEIQNLFELPDPLVNTSIADTIDTYLNQNTRYDRQFTWTPLFLKLYYQHFISDKISFSAKFTHHFFIPYKPALEFGGQYHFSNNWYVGLNSSQGGYSKINIGGELWIRINPKFVIEFTSRYITAILPHRFGGMGFFTNINYKL